MSDNAIPGQSSERLPLGHALALALISGSVIAYELFVMRVFANSGWSHFGSTVVSIAMLGFGVFSTIFCIWKLSFQNRLISCMNGAVLLLGPAMIAANSAAQRVPFNPIFLVSDASQKYYLGCYFLLYFIPFLLGAMFIGLFFFMGQRNFGKVYFANMTGSGVGGVVLFAAMYCAAPDQLFWAPLSLWAAGGVLWLIGQPAGRRLFPVLGLSVLLAALMGAGFVQLNVSPYKGVSYARQFPDAKRVYRSSSPFGLLEVYSSSYFHFAPGLSDAASLHLPEMPEQAFLGMYIDGDGPIGIMKNLPDSQKEYVHFLPVSMPYLLKKQPDVLVMQFGGGISTNAALKMGAKSIVVAEGSPAVIRAVRNGDFVADFTGRILDNPAVRLIPSDGRIAVRQMRGVFDIVDLSLADSTGLSMPGGSPIVERYTYTKETFLACLDALREGGILAVTVWNKEDPPKSALKLFTTIVKAVDEAEVGDIGRNLFVAHTYLSTLTVLCKKGGFTGAEIQELEAYCRKMSFEVVWPHPECRMSNRDIDGVFDAYRSLYTDQKADEVPISDETLVCPTATEEELPLGGWSNKDIFAPGSEGGERHLAGCLEGDVSAGRLYRLVMDRIICGDFNRISNGYIFNTDFLTNDRPYFAGFVKFRDIPLFLDKLEAVSDEWGYLLLWATLLVSTVLGFMLLSLPVAFGWKAFFGKHRGKVGIIIYFLCLGLGYILVEIGLIGKYIECLGNATVSVTVLITGMLLFSGIGSYVSAGFASKPGRTILPVCCSIAALLLFYAYGLDPLLDFVGMAPYWVRIFVCLGLLFPLAFLMGFPFALGMTTLSEMGKEEFFVWAWGINGSFSVVGSALAPILAVSFGLSSTLLVSAASYLLALVSFRGLQSPEVQADLQEVR